MVTLNEEEQRTANTVYAIMLPNGRTPHILTVGCNIFHDDMVPIHTLKDGQVIALQTGELYNSILDICREHRITNRALAFAFILFNYKNPQIYKILNDNDYWRAMNETSGKYLSIFYISQQDSYFGQDLLESDGKEQRGLHELKTNDHLIPMLKRYFELDEKIELPTVLFFQEHNGLLTDYFLLGLDERKLEESFWELQDYIQTAVDNLEKVTKDNYSNSREIFNLLKSGVEGHRLRRKIFKTTQQFPTQLLAGWVVGKV